MMSSKFHEQWHNIITKLPGLLMSIPFDENVKNGLSEALDKNQALQANISANIVHVDKVLDDLNAKIVIIKKRIMDQNSGFSNPDLNFSPFGKFPSDMERKEFGLCITRDNLNESMKPFVDTFEQKERKRKASSCEVWSAGEEQQLLSSVEQHGGHEWARIKIDANLDNKTVLQTFQHFQQSLNNTLSRDVWSAEEDDILIRAHEKFGSSIKCWSHVAELLDGRAASQCRERWKSINPDLNKGRWNAHEERLLHLAVRAHGSKFTEVAHHIPHRDGVKCREKWVNVLSPAIVRTPWTPTEDAALTAAVSVCGVGNWAKISNFSSTSFIDGLIGRTDADCKQRWGQLEKESLEQHLQRQREVKHLLPAKLNRRSHTAVLRLEDLEAGE